MAIWTMLTQDGPQYVIHWLFIFLFVTNVDHSELTVMMSIVCSTFAIMISIFNITMCTPNEFDPIVLQIELKRRQDKLKRVSLQAKKQELKMTQMLEKKHSLRKSQMFSVKELTKLADNKKRISDLDLNRKTTLPKEIFENSSEHKNQIEPSSEIELEIFKNLPIH